MASLRQSLSKLVNVSPPVMSCSQWTSWRIPCEVYRGNLPVPGGSFDLGLIDIAGTYLLIATVSRLSPACRKPASGISLAYSP